MPLNRLRSVSRLVRTKSWLMAQYPLLCRLLSAYSFPSPFGLSLPTASNCKSRQLSGVHNAAFYFAKIKDNFPAIACCSHRYRIKNQRTFTRIRHSRENYQPTFRNTYIYVLEIILVSINDLYIWITISQSLFTPVLFFIIYDKHIQINTKHNF